MFEYLSERLQRSVQVLRGHGRLTEDNTQAALAEVRRSLLEADVALPVVTALIDRVRTQALGMSVAPGVRPGDAFIKLVQEALTELMGERNTELNLTVTPPAIILVVGLQGSGKTTTAAKLGHWLKTQCKKSVLLTSVDIYRPAAIAQMEMLATSIGAVFHPAMPEQSPLDIAQAAVQSARRQLLDAVVIDTAGRLHTDEALMTELENLQLRLQPIETLLVVDGLMGQDAAKMAQLFNARLKLTGVILSKMDGDARGGAALSIRYLTAQPIKFLGNGEKAHALEPFYPERVASRVLGMGDMRSLVEAVQRQADEKTTRKLKDKIGRGSAFNLEDFLVQLNLLQKMQGMSGLLDQLPGNLKGAVAHPAMDGKHIRLMTAVIQSMTLRERRFPHIIQGSHKRRIANGSGTSIQAVNRVLKQREQMQKMIKRAKSGKLQKQLQALSSNFKS